MRVYNKGIALITIPLVFQLVFISVIFVQLEKSEAALDQELNLATKRDLAYNILSVCHTCIFTATEQMMEPDKTLTEKLNNTKERLHSYLSEFQRLDGPTGQAYPPLKRETERFETLLNGVESVSSNQRTPLVPEERHGLACACMLRMEQVEKCFSTLYQSQSATGSKFLVERSHDVARLKLDIVYGVILSIVLAIGVTLAYSQNFVKRIGHLIENSMRLSLQKELLPTLSGQDELAKLDLMFHRVGTILKESMEREKAMFDSAADLICCLNSDGRISRVNRVLSTELGYEVDTASGTAINNFVLAKDHEKMDDALKSARQTLISQESDLRMVSKEGEIRDYTWSIRWEPGYSSFYCVAHDKTERKKLEQAKQDFVAMLSHDLRSPLSALSLTIDLIISGTLQKLPQACIDLFVMADKSVNRLINLVNELLDLEKIEAGSMSLSLRTIPISAVIDLAVETLRASAEARGVRLNTEIEEANVLADEERLCRVLINLISNAIEHAQGEKVVRIEAASMNGKVEVRVIDSGAGIDKQHLEQVFERYKQAPSREPSKGTGLGLSICKAIVIAHGGEIGVDSEVNIGSTFWFRVLQASD